MTGVSEDSNGPGRPIPIPLKDILPLIELIAQEKWTWAKNSDCKYLDIYIDTRKGGTAYIKDRDGDYITLETAMYQYSSENV